MAARRPRGPAPLQRRPHAQAGRPRAPKVELECLIQAREYQAQGNPEVPLEGAGQVG
jgi:hypothetical protein